MCVPVQMYTVDAVVIIVLVPMLWLACGAALPEAALVRPPPAASAKKAA